MLRNRISLLSICQKLLFNEACGNCRKSDTKVHTRQKRAAEHSGSHRRVRHIRVDVLETIRANCRLGTRARVLLHVATNVEVGQWHFIDFVCFFFRSRSLNVLVSVRRSTHSFRLIYISSICWRSFHQTKCNWNGKTVAFSCAFSLSVQTVNFERRQITWVPRAKNGINTYLESNDSWIVQRRTQPPAACRVNISRIDAEWLNGEKKKKKKATVIGLRKVDFSKYCMICLESPHSLLFFSSRA